MGAGANGSAANASRDDPTLTNGARPSTGKNPWRPALDFAPTPIPSRRSNASLDLVLQQSGGVTLNLAIWLL
jgi:hypothetical protein